MEEKRITEQESITIITEMISRTKERYIGDGNIMLMWGWLTVLVAGLVWLMLVLTQNGLWNWLWFLIPIIGCPMTVKMSNKSQQRNGVKTYSDKISSLIWTSVGIIALGITVICIGFNFAGIYAWSAMFIFALIIVPFAEIIQGIVVKEKSLVFGGACGIIIGAFTSCCLVSSIPLYVYWFLPLYMVAFACMMIVPGIVLNRKALRK